MFPLQTTHRRTTLPCRRVVDHHRQQVRFLSRGRWIYDHAITFEDAKELGLWASDEMPEDFMKMMALYPQPVKHQPMVEYLPIPQRSPSTRESA